MIRRLGGGARDVNCDERDADGLSYLPSSPLLSSPLLSSPLLSSPVLSCSLLTYPFLASPLLSYPGDDGEGGDDAREGFFQPDRSAVNDRAQW